MFHVKHKAPHILLINPWITDFAAYNFWIKPLGLLSIASLLRENAFRVTLIDCLDFSIKTQKYGDGRFFKTKIEKPLLFKSIPRNYSQYGIPEEILLKRLLFIEEPDLICVTSGMTYWYPGVFKVVEIIKKLFKNAPIILGGIYATLCYDHAKKYSGVDIVFNGSGEVEILKLISGITKFRIPQSLRARGLSEPEAEFRIDSLPYPAFDLYPRLDYVCLATSRGCPLRCTYCGSPFLTKGFFRRDPLKVVDEIEYWTNKYQVNNIAFYDDALLIEPSKHFIPIMKEVMKRGIRCNFHTPNAIHVKEIDEEVAGLLFRGGFKTIRLGFETSNKDTQIETGRKVDNQEFRQAIKHLKRVGYLGEEIGVYIMIGLPEHRVGEIEESIAFVKEAGAKPMLVEYSPIPYTPLFEKAKRMSKFDLENEPLYHNNSILPCQWDGFTIADYKRLKEDLRRG
ncbi:MAG: hypothetical protein COZ69_15840 [Deltaproteobacteria bacterium CG_4_8_14_3_um_filter_45_9]|nr:MAG: hypothetical protein COZ69_15840 [Deltaproteobacteria bacterium CG_4_8_14_3_um_filter_45_9]